MNKWYQQVMEMLNEKGGEAIARELKQPLVGMAERLQVVALTPSVQLVPRCACNVGLHRRA